MAASIPSPPPDRPAAVGQNPGPAPSRAERLLETLGSRGVEVRLDGTDIRLKAPPGTLDAELLGELRSAKPALVELLAERERAPFALSDIQREIVYAAEVEGATHSYTIVKGLRLAGRLDTGRLRAALAKLHVQHPMLRARIGTDPLVQSVAAGSPVIEELPQASDEAELLSDIGRRAFASEGGPLASWHLAKVGSERHLLVFRCHHAIADGASLRILFEDLAAFYNDPEGEAGRPAPSLGFREHVYRQAVYAGSEDCRRALAGWRAVLDGHDEPVRLSQRLAGLGMAQTSSSGAVHRTGLGSARLQSLEALARRLTCSVTSLLLAGYALLIGQQAGRRSFCLGVPFDRRPDTGFERTFGCFAALLPCPVDLDPAQPFSGLARSLHEEMLDARDRQFVPLSRLRSLLIEGRGESREAPIRVAFSLQAETLPPLPFDGLSSIEIPIERDRSRLDLTLVVDPSAPGGGALNWEYRSAALDEWQVRLISERYLSLLDQALADPMLPLGRLSTLCAADKAAAQALMGCAPAAPFRSAPDLVRGVALERPDHPAIVDGDESWTYAQIVGRSDAMAQALLDQGVRRGEIVFVVLPRSADLTLCELALMTIGAVPAPFDPANPASRLKAAMEQCGASAAIVPDGAPRFDGTGTKWLAPPPAGAAAAGAIVPVEPGREEAAYVIHSSGSTGTPKGAAIPHRALANFVRGLQSADLIRPGDRCLHSSGPGFDAAIIEAWGALCAGATLVVVPDVLRTDPDGLFGFIAANRVTTAWIPTPVLNAILASGAPDVPAATPLRMVTTGGDRLAHFPPAGFPCPVANMYGPCENAPVSTVETLPPGSGAGAGPGDSPPIGKPLPGISAYVLDDWGRPCPIGVEGELHLAGESLATGYVGLDSLTRDRFVEDPIVPGRATYRTGDRVEIAPGGVLLFVGRRDRQVQVEGVRVEPGEIEAALRRIPWVSDARVIPAVPSGLAAFVACDRSPDEIRCALGAHLPAAMMPRQIHCLERFPLTPNGKVDLADLRLRASRAPEARAAAAPPDPGLEPVRRLWEEILGCPVTCAEDDFFRLGGTSVDAARLTMAIRQRQGVRLPVSLLYRHSSLAAFGSALAAAARPGSGEAAPGGIGQTIAQIEGELEALCRAKDVPGVQIAIGTPDGIVDLAWGRRDIERDLPVTRETVYPLSCCMKALFATALSSLDLQGRIDLSAPLVSLYPEALELLPGTHRGVTLLDLLGHVAGLDDGRLQARTRDFRRDGTLPRVTGSLDFLAPPRSVYLYSSLGYILLSDALERCTGLDWSRLIRQELLEPLGIAADAGTAARRFARAGPAQPWRNLPVDEAQTGHMAGAASSAIRLSAHDLVRMMDNLVAGQGPAPAYRPANLAKLTGWSFPIRAHPYRESSLVGWVRHWNGTIGHLGAGPGCMSYMHFCPETKRSFAMLSSCEESFDLYLDLCERLFGPFEPPPEPPLGLARILGTYRSALGQFALEPRGAELELHRTLPGGGLRSSLLTAASGDGVRWKLLDRQEEHFPTDSIEFFEVDRVGLFARCGPTAYRKTGGSEPPGGRIDAGLV